MRITKSSDFVLRNIHGSYFLINIKQKYDEENRAVIETNETGKIIWELLSDIDDIDLLLNSVVQMYNVSASEIETIKNDIWMFLAYLKALGCVVYG